MRFTFKNTFLFWLVLGSCYTTFGQHKIIPAAEQIATYAPLIKGKNVGLVAHKASILIDKGKTIHLVDKLSSSDIALKKIYAPEHGFRGNADDGEKIKNTVDQKTGLPILSLYGKQRKPSSEMLSQIEVMLFDLQDVGARFYTYLSTLHYVMEACAENNIPLIVLDRPNPNAHYVDGPVLDMAHKTFVGMHPVPIVYGMTIGEYAQMINGEGWLENGLKVDLTVIPIKNYTHKTPYRLPVRPSPNLPNAQSVALYPSLCLLEPTIISIGRGTNTQFQIYGHPDFKELDFSFTPQPNFNYKNPKLKGQLCYGIDLQTIVPPKKIELKWLLDAYDRSPNKSSFFLKGFTRIAGNTLLQKQIEAGLGETEIRASWEDGLKKFNKIRAKYLIYH